MVTEPDQVIVQAAECGCHSVSVVHVHHRHFPEIRAECGTAAEGAAHLSRLLARELEWSGDQWHRDSIRKAVGDVGAFANALDRPDVASR